MKRKLNIGLENKDIIIITINSTYMFGTDFIISIFAGLMSRWTKSLECSSFKPAARIKDMDDVLS